MKELDIHIETTLRNTILFSIEKSNVNIDSLQPYLVVREFKRVLTDKYKVCKWIMFCHIAFERC